MFTGEEIKRLRQQKGLSQQEFADKLGLTRELISKMEGGKLSVSKSTDILLREYASQIEVKNLPNSEENPPQGQVLEQSALVPMSSLDKLIQANADQSAAVKDIAAANMELVMMLKGEKGNATVHAESRNLEREIANLDRLLAGTIKLLADQKKTSFEEVEAAAHIAGGEILQSYKTGIQSAKDKSYS